MCASGICPMGSENEEFDKRIEDVVIYQTVVNKTSTYQKKFVYDLARRLFGTVDLTRAYTKGRK